MNNDVLNQLSNICSELLDGCYASIVNSKIKQCDYLDTQIFNEDIIKKSIKYFFIEFILSKIKYRGNSPTTIFNLNGEIVIEPDGVYFCYLDNTDTLLLCVDNLNKYTEIGKIVYNSASNKWSDIKNKDVINIKHLNLEFISKVEKKINIEQKNHEMFILDLVDEIIDNQDEKNSIKEIIVNTFNQIKQLIPLKISGLYKINKNKFNEILCSELIKNYEEDLNLTNEEKGILQDGIINSKHAEKLLKLIYTFIYTKSIISNEDEYDFYDLTFVSVSIFKVVEVLFAELLNNAFPNKIIKDRSGKSIDLGNSNLTLGQMYQIFVTNDVDILNFKEKNKKIFMQTKDILSKWIHVSRNGFLHKDIIEVENIEQLNNSIDDSIKIIYLLILLFN